MTNWKWLGLKCWRNWEGVQLTNFLELLGMRGAEKENPKKENPEGFISVFTRPACWYMKGEASILPAVFSEAAWLQF